MKGPILILFIVIIFKIEKINSNVTSVVSGGNDYPVLEDGYFLDDLNEIGLAASG